MPAAGLLWALTCIVTQKLKIPQEIRFPNVCYQWDPLRLQ